MKNIRLLFLFILSVLFMSCEKELEYPSDTYPTFENQENKPSITLWGKFKLISAVMYVKNNEINVKEFYNHFDLTKTESSMHWGGSIYEIQTIFKDSTTFSFYPPTTFPGYGKFVLNDEVDKHYSVYYIGQNKRIVEDPIYGVQQQLIGGGSLPFSGQTIDYENKLVRIQIFESNANIFGYNCKYWTELTMQKIEEWD